MLYPIDNSELKMSERQGIEIDFCSKCRGVWLDRGELDKIIERSESESSDRYSGDRRENRRNDRHQDDEEEGGFISNIFGGFGRGDD